MGERFATLYRAPREKGQQARQVRARCMHGGGSVRQAEYGGIGAAEETGGSGKRAPAEWSPVCQGRIVDRQTPGQRAGIRATSGISPFLRSRTYDAQQFLFQSLGIGRRGTATQVAFE